MQTEVCFELGPASLSFPLPRQHTWLQEGQGWFLLVQGFRLQPLGFWACGEAQRMANMCESNPAHLRVARKERSEEAGEGLLCTLNNLLQLGSHLQQLPVALPTEGASLPPPSSEGTSKSKSLTLTFSLDLFVTWTSLRSVYIGPVSSSCLTEFHTLRGLIHLAASRSGGVGMAMSEFSINSPWVKVEVSTQLWIFPRDFRADFFFLSLGRCLCSSAHS